MCFDGAAVTARTGSAEVRRGTREQKTDHRSTWGGGVERWSAKLHTMAQRMPEPFAAIDVPAKPLIAVATSITSTMFVVMCGSTVTFTGQFGP